MHPYLPSVCHKEGKLMIFALITSLDIKYIVLDCNPETGDVRYTDDETAQ